MTISFDLDGTCANLYGVDNWLEYLLAEDATPYAVAKPLINFSLLARYLNQLQKQGYKIQVVSWLPKGSSQTYDVLVTLAKIEWLKRHLPSVHWDNIHIIPYGTNKTRYCYTAQDILFDDEPQNRDEWNGQAYDEKNILEILRKLLDKSKRM